MAVPKKKAKNKSRQPLRTRTGRSASSECGTSAETSGPTTSPSGQVVYNVTIDRLWRDDDETNDGGEVTKKGEWHQSQSFGRDDLLLVGKVADFCHTWIYQRLQDRSREAGLLTSAGRAQRNTIGNTHTRFSREAHRHHRGASIRDLSAPPNLIESDAASR